MCPLTCPRNSGAILARCFLDLVEDLDQVEAGQGVEALDLVEAGQGVYPFDVCSCIWYACLCLQALAAIVDPK
jgi:hypothetical protein